MYKYRKPLEVHEIDSEDENEKLYNLMKLIGKKIVK